MAPVVKELQRHETIETIVCVTAQHREMLDQVLRFFDIIPDFDLNLMKPNQTLFDVTADGLKQLQRVFDKCMPDLVCVQGDTTTAFIGALAAFYKGIKVAHIEAGLRSGDKYSPFPEEMNRTLVGHLADYHFAPTEKAKQNLLREGITKNVHIVGNTVIDALFLCLSIIERQGDAMYREFFSFLEWSKKIVLVTGHRRESFGGPFENICLAIQEIAKSNPDVQVVYPVHLNPNVRIPVIAILNNIDNVHLIDPLDYPYLIFLQNHAHIVLTDSGGIQEEAPSLGKPVLVMRDVTERTEGIEAGTAKLIGTDRQRIVREVSILLAEEEEYRKMTQACNPYGDGQASPRIVAALARAGRDH